MPAPIYEATAYDPSDYAGTRSESDHHDEDDARKYVESKGEGRIVKFARHYNLPGAMPEIVCSSIWMDVYENGVWHNANINTA